MREDIPLIRVDAIHYTYNEGSDGAIEALRGISLCVQPGEYLAVVGHNGSGKSTLAKCLNGLLLPQQGDVFVESQSTRTSDGRLYSRATVGIVLQNPDNQFVATTVEEEVAFGPENLGVPHPALRRRVDEALALSGLTEIVERNPRTLSAGQKARLAIASVLAMQPRCLILDESTALLDPLSRRQVLALLAQLHTQGLAVVAITHSMDEASQAERIVVLDHGHLLLVGKPAEVFARRELLQELNLGLSAPAALAAGLRDRGLPLTGEIAEIEQLEAALLDARGRRR